MTFQFQQYSIGELRNCGHAFVAEFSTERSNRTKETTAAVKQFFARAAAPGVSILGCNGRGELMLDQCHVSYRPRQNLETGLAYWDAILQQPIAMRLAVESEWGKFKSPTQSLVDLLDDAQKLALVRADAKVMIFATRCPTDLSRFVDRIIAIRLATADPSPWLWIDLPWLASITNPPVFGVLEG